MLVLFALVTVGVCIVGDEAVRHIGVSTVGVGVVGSGSLKTAGVGGSIVGAGVSIVGAEAVRVGALGTVCFVNVVSVSFGSMDYTFRVVGIFCNYCCSGRRLVGCWCWSSRQSVILVFNEHVLMA